MYRCGRCLKDYQYRQSLWRHKKKCQPHRFDGNVNREAVNQSLSPPVKKQRTKEEIIGYSDDESLELEPIDTYKRANLMSLVDKIVNRPVPPPSPPSHVVDEVFRETAKKAGESSSTIKTAAKSEENANKAGETSKGRGLLLRGRGLDDDDDTDSDESEQEGDACEKEKEKALRKLVNARIRKPKRKLKKLMKALKEDGVDISHLEELVDDFLASEEKEIIQELYDVLGKLKPSSKAIEIEMVLKEIERENYRINTILRRLDQADPQVLPSILEGMKRDELIDGKLYETLAEKPYSILEIIGLLKDPTTGSGLYLPGSPKEMIDKLALLIGEFTAGNTTVKEQIKVLLEKMWETDILMYQDYKTLCEKLGICPRV